MGKPTGFLEYDRVTSTAEEPEQRIKHFNEFHKHLPKEEQQKQGARCMECGVPFCQAGMTIAGMTSGCPLNNLVPEWNDLVYTGNWERAYNRLKKTNNFPEFKPSTPLYTKYDPYPIIIIITDDKNSENSTLTTVESFMKSMFLSTLSLLILLKAINSFDSFTKLLITAIPEKLS